MQPPLDPRELRQAFGAFMTGVTVVITRDAHGTPLGFTANSFTSVSLDPPLLLVCPSRGLSSFDAFADCDHFSVSILAEGQEAVSNIFAGYDGDRFTKVDTHDDPHGIPQIEYAAAHFSCRRERLIEAGDHALLIGEVVAFANHRRRGLGYAGGRYFSLGLEQAASEPTDDQRAIVGAIVECKERLLVIEDSEGCALPTVPLGQHDSTRTMIAQRLESLGLNASIEQVYSIYDNQRLKRHETWFRVRARNDASVANGRWCTPVELESMRFASAEQATMVQRYALESRARRFGLYVGSENRGEVHHPSIAPEENEGHV
ncbi:flavin reductase family protein [Gammaproteobacteria bacterium]|nr:flavin reductase family protein [Gammaproteobacteria bacterium]